MDQAVYETKDQFSRVEWFSLPLRLRVKWWEETDYSTKPPSIELMDEIRAAIVASSAR